MGFLGNIGVPMRKMGLLFNFWASIEVHILTNWGAMEKWLPSLFWGIQYVIDALDMSQDSIFILGAHIGATLGTLGVPPQPLWLHKGLPWHVHSHWP